MKIAVLCDTHFGARNDSPIFLHYFFRFLDEVFFPHLEREGITEVLHLGDLMDRRKFVNFATLHETRERFIQRLIQKGIRANILLGNHDTYFRNTSSINSIEELFGGLESQGITVHKDPTELTLGGTKFLLLPWINRSNEEVSRNLIAKTDAPIVLGHLELTGFEVLRGTKFENGMDPAPLKRFQAVYSGHFHCKHSKDNVHYLGTPYQITFGDLNEPKGFHVFDTEDRSMQYVENPLRIFGELGYDDAAIDYTKQMPDMTRFKETFVRVRVQRKRNPAMFDLFMDNLNMAGAHGVTVMEDKGSETELSDTVDVSKDTLSLINQEIDGLEVTNPVKLKSIIRDLYMESLFI
jgi:DNA repair exonuclease SbcCD nuclease subunit